MARTDKFKGILRFVDEWGFITTKICANIFYKDATYSLNMAQRTLKKLFDRGFLVVNSLREGKEGIYQYKKEVVSDHRYFLLNLYSEIYKYTDDVIYFKTEEYWSVSKKRSDAHIIFCTNENGNMIPHSYLIEFDKFSKTGSNKYDLIYKTNEVQEWYLNNYGMELFPDVLLINPLAKETIISGHEYKVVAINYDFDELLQKVIL